MGRMDGAAVEHGLAVSHTLLRRASDTKRDMKDEMASFLARDDKIWYRSLTEPEMHDRVSAVAEGHTDDVVETYRRLYPDTNAAERLIATLTDSNFRIRSLTVAERKATQGAAPVFMYSFEWETPVHAGRLKSPHAMDVPFTFDTIDLTKATDDGPEAHKLAATMSATWAAFAHSGVPEHPSLPDWPPYDLGRRATMILDKHCRIEDDPRSAVRSLWQRITACN